MAEKDVDEQFAAIMARWDDEALGHDPYGDPTADPHSTPEITRVSDVSDIADVPSLTDRPDGVNPPLPMTPPPAAPPPSTAPRHRTGQPYDPDNVAAPEPPTLDDRDDVDRDDLGGIRDIDDLDRLSGESDEDVHYSPPPPAPLPPSEDKHFWTMMGALVTGPVLFLYLLLFNRDGNGWWMIFAVLVSVVGFVLLVLRQPLERDEDDDGIRL